MSWYIHERENGGSKWVARKNGGREGHVDGSEEKRGDGGSLKTLGERER